MGESIFDRGTIGGKHAITSSAQTSPGTPHGPSGKERCQSLALDRSVRSCHLASTFTPSGAGNASPSKPAKRTIPQPLTFHMDDGDAFTLPTTRSLATLGSTQTEE